MIAEPLDDELGWLVQVPWLSTLGLVSLAVAVVLVGWVLQKRAGNFGSQGRKISRSSLNKFDLAVSRLETLPLTSIVQAKAGDVHIEGRFASAVGSLGGPSKNACIWHNRAGADRDAAVGTELVLLSDGSGQIGIENISHARVIAPVESKPGGRDSISLYLGDRVQLLGKFSPEVLGKDDDPKLRVYGFLGREGPIQVRLLDRYTKFEASQTETTASSLREQSETNRAD